MRANLPGATGNQTASFGKQLLKEVLRASVKRVRGLDNLVQSHQS